MGRVTEMIARRNRSRLWATVCSLNAPTLLATGVLCSVLSVATILTLIAKPTYQSSMQLLIEYQERRGPEPETEFADTKIEIDYTQINVM